MAENLADRGPAPERRLASPSGAALVLGAVFASICPAVVRAEPLPSSAATPEEAAREAELFGAPAAAPPAEPTPNRDAPDSQAEAEAAREAELSGAPEGPRSSPPSPDPASVPPGGEDPDGPPPPAPRANEDDRDRPALRPAEETLAVGGRLILRLEALNADGQTALESRLSSGNLLDIYLDARPNERLRTYFSGRILYDPTAPEEPDLFGQQRTDAQINQLWIKWDIGRVAFLTVGAQPIRWGTGRVWNPTDVVNRARLDPLAFIDLRTGVPLAKVEIPIEALGGSLQVIADLADADEVGDVGGAARLQIAGTAAEVSLTAGARRDRPLFLGTDVSTALGPLDLYGELVVARGGDAHRWRGDFSVTPLAIPGREDRGSDWIPQALVGIEWPIAYGDNDQLIIGGEYLYNDAGYRDAQIYPWLLAQGDFQPLYLGRHYAAAFMVLMGPGTWNDTSFVLTGISNLSDRTGVVRLNVSHRIVTALYIEPFIGGFVGDRGGEFRFALDLPGDLLGQPEDIVIPPARLQAGIWLRTVL